MASATKEYRVVVAGVSYIEPTETANGTVPVYKVARFGEQVALSDEQAKRLSELGPMRPDGSRGPAVKPADAPASYDEMTVPELEDLAKERDLDVRGSGANGAVLKEDLVNALNTYDQGGQTPAPAAAKK